MIIPGVNAATVFTDIKQDATTTSTGVVETAENSELIAGTPTGRVVTVGNMVALKASQGEVDTGTDADKYVTPETLKGNLVAGRWKKISTQTITTDVAAVEFTDIDSTYDVYKLTWTDFLPRSGLTYLSLRVGTGATPTWQTGSVYSRSAEGGAGTYDRIYLTTSASTIYSSSGIAYVYSPSDTSVRTRIAVKGSHYHTIQGSTQAAIDYTSTTAVTGLQLFFSSITSDVKAGIASLYGCRL
ncbi:MAG: hypothetical protein JRE23_18605 [Deltaproteobacteria bacterium]|nr:hypothetical protein [Deltaproteobacteria bacterium]